MKKLICKTYGWKEEFINDITIMENTKELYVVTTTSSFKTSILKVLFDVNDYIREIDSSYIINLNTELDEAIKSLKIIENNLPSKFFN